MCSDPKMSVHHAEFKLEGHAIVYEKWKWKTSKWSFNLHPCTSPMLHWPNEVILDVLEWWGQGKQLSCWTLFHLKLVSWWIFSWKFRKSNIFENFLSPKSNVHFFHLEQLFLWTSNEKRSLMKVVALSNLFNLVTNLTSFGFGMKELCILQNWGKLLVQW